MQNHKRIKKTIYIQYDDHVEKWGELTNQVDKLVDVMDDEYKQKRPNRI